MLKSILGINSKIKVPRVTVDGITLTASGVNVVINNLRRRNAELEQNLSLAYATIRSYRAALQERHLDDFHRVEVK
jgi:hypothetical protein